MIFLLERFVVIEGHQVRSGRMGNEMDCRLNGGWESREFSQLLYRSHSSGLTESNYFIASIPVVQAFCASVTHISS
jgi:hypothetical protein